MQNLLSMRRFPNGVIAARPSFTKNYGHATIACQQQEPGNLKIPPSWSFITVN
jgi:hypothetical protein